MMDYNSVRAAVVFKCSTLVWFRIPLPTRFDREIGPSISHNCPLNDVERPLLEEEDIVK